LSQPVAAPPAPAEEVVLVPEGARGRPISLFPMSVRLQNILAQRGFRLLGDIHGVTYATVLKFRNCGRKTVAELRQVLRQAETASAGEPAPFAPLVGRSLVVPPAIADLQFVDLPISTRLEGIFEREKLTRLGDLHGVSLTELRGMGNCGNKTIAEILRLIEKAANGQFEPGAQTDVRRAPRDLIQILETLLDALPPRKARMLRLRLGGEEYHPLTLLDTGLKFHLSRERIRQIVQKTAVQLRREGSRKLGAYLRQLEHVCLDSVCPLTPPLLQLWLGQDARACRFAPAFYVRLLCEIHPALPAWPEGQEPSPKRGTRSAAIEARVNAALRNRLSPVPLPEMLASVRTRLPNVNAGEFLRVLRRSTRLRVAFPQPDRPVVRRAR
jgi:hypothetical protein